MEDERHAAAASWLREVGAELALSERTMASIESRLVPVLAASTDAQAMGVLLARGLCEDGDHVAEAAVGRRLVEAAGDDVGAAGAAWLVVVDALMHVALREAAREGVLERVRDEARSAVAQVGTAAHASGLSAAARRRLLDPILAVLLEAERALGLPPSTDALDLERRREARRVPRPGAATFLARHGAGVAALARREGRAWWHDRFVERFGCDPPAGWWTDDADGGWIAPRGREEGWFEDADERAFADDMEARYRAAMDLPARGEGWVSGPHLARCVEAALPGLEVIREASAPWLGRQRLDVYVPALGVALEYQGEQHFLPLPHWGGEAGLALRRELDERKRDACVRAGIRLVEWRYDDPVSVDAVRRRLESIGILSIS